MAICSRETQVVSLRRPSHVSREDGTGYVSHRVNPQIFFFFHFQMLTEFIQRFGRLQEQLIVQEWSPSTPRQSLFIQLDDALHGTVEIDPLKIQERVIQQMHCSLKQLTKGTFKKTTASWVKQSGCDVSATLGANSAITRQNEPPKTNRIRTTVERAPSQNVPKKQKKH